MRKVMEEEERKRNDLEKTLLADKKKRKIF